MEPAGKEVELGLQQEFPDGKERWPPLEVFRQARQRSAVDPALNTRLAWPLEISSNSMIPWKRFLSDSP